MKIPDCLKNIPHFLSGSRRFKTNKSDSDYDYCVVIQNRQKIIDHIYKKTKKTIQ